jgi:hypothetical protein
LLLYITRMAHLFKKNTWTIDLEKLPAYVEWNGDWKYELDSQMIQLILDCDELDEFGNPKITNVMKTHFKKNIVDKMRNGVLHIKWSGRKGNLGRRYSAKDPDDIYEKSSCNLGVHSKYIKNTMYSFMGWIDYDMVAGHPTLLCEVAKITNKTGGLPAVQEYISNRDATIQQLIDYYSVVGEDEEETKKYRITEDEMKDLFNLTIYGGGHSTWTLQLAEGDEKKGKYPKPIANKPPHPKWEAYKNEINSVIELVYANNQKLVEKVCDGENMTEWKRKSRTMSYFCGILENECLKWAYKYGVKNKLFPERSGDLCYDGFTMPPPPSNIDLNYHIEEMNAFILKKTGFAIKIKVKPFKNVISSIISKRNTTLIEVNNAIPVAEDVEAEVISVSSTDYASGVVETDQDAVELIMEKLKDHLKYSKGALYFKRNHIWITGDLIERAVFNYIMKCDIKTYNANGDLKPYCNFVRTATSLTKAVLNRVMEDNNDELLYDKFVSSTKGRLCFKDGVLDLIKRKFYKWDEIDFEYYSPIQIPRNYGDYFARPNMYLVSHLERSIFKPLFPHNTKSALRFLARGVAGEIDDKHWAKYIGNRNCGKGVFEKLLKCSLGEYFRSIEAGNFLVNANRQLKSEQPEKLYAFALDFQFARIGCSQEMPPPTKNNTIKMNGEIFKKLCSGGDGLKGKRNYDIFITEFINQARLIIMCNDCPPLTNDDALQTCYEFENTLQFISEEEYNILQKKYLKSVEKGEMSQEEMGLLMGNYKIGNPNIKALCATDEYMNAFIMLMCLHYGKIIPKDNLLDKEDDGEMQCVNGLRTFILEHFKITKNEEHYLTNSQIEDVFLQNDYGDISKKKIATELKSLGLVGKTKWVEDKKPRVWVGISIK